MAGIATHGGEHLYVWSGNAIRLGDPPGDARIAMERQFEMRRLRTVPKRHIDSGVELWCRRLERLSVRVAGS